MKKETRIALDQSIAHWENTRKEFLGRTVRPWMTRCGCALCVRFNGCELNGEKCPVFARTGLDGCRKTPYAPIPSLEAMDREITFLRSLREVASSPDTVK